MATTETNETSQLFNNTGSDNNPLLQAFESLSVILCVILNAVVLFVMKHQKELQEFMRVLYQILAVSNLMLGISWNIWSVL